MERLKLNFVGVLRVEGHIASKIVKHHNDMLDSRFVTLKK